MVPGVTHDGMTSSQGLTGTISEFAPKKVVHVKQHAFVPRETGVTRLRHQLTGNDSAVKFHSTLQVSPLMALLPVVDDTDIPGCGTNSNAWDMPLILPELSRTWGTRGFKCRNGDTHEIG